MYMTIEEFFAFCTLIIAIIALVVEICYKNKKKITACSPKVTVIFN